MRTLARGGLRSRAKGKRGEREIVRLARQYGLQGERTWTTAQAANPAARHCDVRIAGHAAQVKVARRGFETFYRALDGVDFAFLRQDRRPWLAVLPARDLFQLLNLGDGGCADRTRTSGKSGPAIPISQRQSRVKHDAASEIEAIP